MGAVARARDGDCAPTSTDCVAGAVVGVAVPGAHDAPAAPELTVAIAAFGTERPLVETLRSLAHQTNVTCEILVIDDGLVESSTVSDVAVLDRRIRVYRNERPLGDVGSLQRAVDNASGAAITFVEPGDTLLAGALRTMCDAMIDVGGVSMAHAYWVPRSFLSRVSRRSLRAHRAALLEHLPPGIDHRAALVMLGNIVQALPTFQRTVLQADGGLVGNSVDEAFYAATLNALRHGEARIIPKVLCATGSPRNRGWKLRRRPSRLGSVARSYPRGWSYSARRLRTRFGVWARSAPGFRALLHVRRRYEIFGDLIPERCFPLLHSARRGSSPIAMPRVAYVLWRYPTLSETFIRREITALRDSGMPLEVVALEPDDPPLAPDIASPAGTVTYYGATDDDAARAFLKECLRRSPVTVMRLWLWLMGHHYHPHKTWWRDRNTFFDAAHLALALRKLGVTHVHSPWADQTATRSSIAARLLGVTFSVQARAAEIHKTTEPPPVLERLRTARFVITNSRYNEKYLAGLLSDGTTSQLSVIYNGVDLPRFHPVEAKPINGPARLVCVARLAEFKGMTHLLRVCGLLRDAGVDFTCEIIGGPEDGMYTAAWVQLRKLHTELDLDSHVRFRGAQPFSVVLGTLRDANLFVLPCVHARDGAHDITPNALIEAMALGLPVISTTTGAIPEIVDHEVNGLLVTPGDETALLTAIERLLGDDNLRRQFGQAARRKVEERFDIARNVEQRISLFRSI